MKCYNNQIIASLLVIYCYRVQTIRGQVIIMSIMFLNLTYIPVQGKKIGNTNVLYNSKEE